MSVQVSDAEDAIANGRRFYNAKQYRPALEQFTIAMKLCPCSRKMKRSRCLCKNFEKVAAENGDIFKEAMYNCHCAVGKTFNKCDKSVHIQALDYRAATFEVIKQLERAKRDAEWILELAPRLPDGYLRLGKIARLMKDDEFAWKLFSAGIDVVSANGQSHSSKAKSLYAASKPLQMKFYRKDPLQLPADIVYWIMLYCDLVTRVRCLRVSKSWKGALTATVNTWLWKDLEFTGRAARRPPPIQGLRKLADYAGRDVRRIIIPFANSFGLIQSKLNVLLSGAKNLEQLEIGFPMRGLEVPRYAGMCKSLKHLKLSHFNPTVANKHSEPDVITAFPLSFIVNAADTLEHLHLDGLPSDWFHERDVPLLPRLQSLRMQLKSTTLQTLPLFHIATKTPALEDLWLNEVWTDPPHNWYENWDVVWPHLKNLTVVGGNAMLQEALVGIVALTSLHHGKTLQHIDLSFSYRDEGVSLITKEPMDEIVKLGGMPLPPDIAAVSRPNSYDAIQSVRLHGIPLNPAMAREMFEHAIFAGNLHTMDIVFPLDVLNSTMGSSSISYLAGYGWLKGAATIRTMGVTRFRFRSYPRSEDDLPLPAFLASFPNLEELEIGSAYYEEAELCMVIEAIIKVTKLKVLYQSQIRGAMMDQLMAIGGRHGVKMIWGERPRPWPVVLNDEQR